MDTIKEKGQASLRAELTDGVITITHGDSGEILAQWTAEAGDWDKIWQVIRALESGNAIDIKEARTLFETEHN